MMMCSCDDDQLAFVDATGDGQVAEIRSNGATGDAGDVDAISSEGFLLRFFDVGTKVGEGAGRRCTCRLGGSNRRDGEECLGRLSSLSKGM